MRKEFFAQTFFSLAIVIAMLMVAVEVTPWVSFLSMGMLIWKWGTEKYHWQGLSRRFTSILSILLLGQVLFQYRTIVGQEPSYTLLLGLSGLRVMDYSTERDHRFVSLLGFILISVKALFSIDIYWIVPSIFAFWGIWYSLLPQNLQNKERVLGRIFLLSVPLAVILFFAFPRVVIPWAMSRGSTYGQIGFTDEVNPGRVAEIAGSSQLAFRAKIDKLPFDHSRDLYWRGSVLTSTRGLVWRPTPFGTRPEEVMTGKGSVSYEVAIEPTSQNFLFALEGTQVLTLEAGKVTNLSHAVFRTSRPIVSTLVYQGQWVRDYQDRSKPTDLDLKIPELKGRVLEWVTEANKKSLSTEGRLELLKNFFLDNKFVYTLSPGTYGANDLESFLFERRRGFCEHFAGAYAVLARGLGVPARVVVGYQGGKYNPIGNFWRIAQRDAHAWAEVYDGSSWKRVDPTSWVAPLRLVIGAEDFFGLSESDQEVFARQIDWRPKNQGTRLWWDRATFFVEDMNYRWSYFLMEFDRSSQDSFFALLGQYKLLSFVAISFAVLLFFVLVQNLFKTRVYLSPEQSLLNSVQEWGHSHNLHRAASESPLHYFDRVAERFPGLTEILKRISTYYDQSKYAGIQNADNPDLLKKQWMRESRKAKEMKP
ncbi:transglutaminaseTgpA domain-containing protein [Bdellovibrio sp. HCB274]|uniref:transglutaminase family protein n=1 Tax=Bdellovibrio sp. HCB274 TaxID=3394361 RepID=UPI0039B695FB